MHDDRRPMEWIASHLEIGSCITAPGWRQGSQTEIGGPDAVPICRAGFPAKARFTVTLAASGATTGRWESGS